jgi:hypothetical protein
LLFYEGDPGTIPPPELIGRTTSGRTSTQDHHMLIGHSNLVAVGKPGAATGPAAEQEPRQIGAAGSTGPNVSAGSPGANLADAAPIFRSQRD